MKGYGQHHYQSLWLLVILLILGRIFGGWVGQAHGQLFPSGLSRTWGSMSDYLSTTLNLDFLNLTFGCTFKVDPCHSPWFYGRSHYLSALIRVVACAGDYPGFVFATAGGAFETSGRFF